MKISKTLMIIASVICLAVSAGAQEYPAKAVKIIIPFTAGSATDFVARTVGQELSKIWAQPVVFENLAGAGGTIGTEAVAKSPPGGYTLLISGAYAASPSLYSTLPYNPDKDFVDIAPLARQPMAFLVGASSGLTSAAEVVAQAKARPGEIKFASPGIGSGAHLAAEKFNSKAGIKVVHIPFKGGPETIGATAKGVATYSLLPIAAAQKGVKAGKLHALAITDTKRSGALPDVPTLAEAGFAGAESIIWWGMWAPAGTPTGTLHKLENDIAKALASPAVLEKFKKRALEPMHMNSAEFSQFVRDEMKNVAQVVKDAGIQRK